MSHTWKNEGNVLALAQIATALVAKDLVLGATVRRDLGSEFDGKRGATINVKTPATLKANSRKLTTSNTEGQYATIEVSDVTEATQAVSLTAQIYSAVDVSVAEQELEIEDFSAEVTAPQTLALVEDIEDRVVKAMQAITANTIISASYSASAPVKTFNKVRKALRDLGVPASGMFAAVGTGVYQDLLNAAVLQQVDMSGSSQALRDAVVGRVAGFTTLESNRLAEDEAVFYHRDGIALVLRAPAAPRGGAVGASVSANGAAVSLVQDYDSKTMTERQILHTLIGAQTFKLRVVTNGTASDLVPALRLASLPIEG